MSLLVILLNPDGAKVEDTPDSRRPSANAVCCCEAAAIYMRALGNEGDGCILLFTRTAAFPEGKQNGEIKGHLKLIITVNIKLVLKTMKSV
jgi:hypothetical protein